MKKIFCIIGLLMLSAMTACGAQAPAESTETIYPEVPEDIPPDTGENVTGGIIDGESKPEQQGGTRAEVKSSGGELSVELPDGWTYDLYPEGSISFYPKSVTEGAVELFYTSGFGVCGTGLEEVEIELAEDMARAGYYDGSDRWSFIVFLGKNNNVVATTNCVDDWWEEYGDQAMQILDSVRMEP